MTSLIRPLGVASLIVLVGCLRPAAEGERPGPDGGGGAGGGTGGGTPVAYTLGLSPAQATLPQGGVLRFTATRVGDDGSTVDVSDQVALAVSPADVLQLDGLSVRALKAGTAEVRATLEGLTATALVAVPAATVAAITLTPDEVEVASGATIRLAAVATLSDGTAVDVTGAATWTSSVGGVVESVGSGVFIARRAGDARLDAAVAGVSASALVHVRSLQLRGVTVTPASVTVPAGTSAQLAALATWEDGSTADVTLAATWTSSGPVATVDGGGRVAGVSAGSATITAALGAAQGTAVVSVTAAAATSLTLTPAVTRLTPGARGALAVHAQYTDGTEADVTVQASFSSSSPAVAVSNAAGTRGQLTALSPGTATVTALFAGLRVTAQVTVTAASLLRLDLVPPPQGAVTVGAEGSFRATGSFSDGSVLDVTEQATWTTDDARLATVSNATGRRGRVTGVGPGQTVVRARLGTATAEAPVTVVGVTLQSFQVAPGTARLEAGATISLRAMALFNDGSTRDVSEQSTWTSSDALTATVSNARNAHGEVRAVRDGQVTITATYQGGTATAVVTVSAPQLVQLAVSPGALRLPAGLSDVLEATAAYSDGTTEDVSGMVEWASSSPGVADVVVYQGYAYVVAGTAGTATVTARLVAEGLSATSTITVVNAALTRIDVTPASPQLPVGTIDELNATGIFSDLSTAYLRYSVSWTSSDPSVVTVGNSYSTKGQLTALSPGTAVLSATFNGVTGTAVVTVTGATLQEIQVTPFAPQLPTGFDVYFRATGLYSDNSTRDLSYLVSWTTSAPATATVTSWGMVSPVAPGAATISAAYQGVRGSTQLTVTGARLTGIAVTSSASGALAVQATRQLVATGTFSDGSQLDVTWYVTWLSSQPPVVSVSNAWPTQGEAKGLSVGTAIISAVKGGVTGTTSLTVQ